jgi:subtilisin family serine protease
MRSVIALLLLVAVAYAQLAPLLHADNHNVINGSYIIILKDGLEITDRDSHVLTLKEKMSLAADGSEVGWLYNIGTMMGFSAKLSEALLKAELAHPDVKYIEADQIMSINTPAATTTQTNPTWGLDRIDQRNLPLDKKYTYNSVAGTGVDVYVIDTGILTTHVDFGGRATSVFNAITGESPTDLNGHGTHCAGTIGGTTYGVAKKVALKAVKVLSGSGSGTNSGVISGVNYVTNNKSPSRQSVASMSLGGGASTALDNAVTASINAGIPYAVAAGNDNANACNYSPAKTASAVTVGATTSTDARASYSNYGTCVDIFAPGSSITSDWIGSSNTATNTISGTSMATPHVAGVIALHLSLHPGQSPATVTSWLNSQATPSKVTNPGTGSPNRLLYSPTD